MCRVWLQSIAETIVPTTRTVVSACVQVPFLFASCIVAQAESKRHAIIRPIQREDFTLPPLECRTSHDFVPNSQTLDDQGDALHVGGSAALAFTCIVPPLNDSSYQL